MSDESKAKRLRLSGAQYRRQRGQRRDEDDQLAKSMSRFIGIFNSTSSSTDTPRPSTSQEADTAMRGHE